VFQAWINSTPAVSAVILIFKTIRKAILQTNMRHGVAWFVLSLVLPGRAASDPEELLSRARSRLQSAARGLSKYACIETVERQYYLPVREDDAAPQSQAAGSFCAMAEADRNSIQGAPKLDATDRLRLEVTISEGREIYSFPGATRFDTRNIDEIIRQGPIGTGSFGAHLLGVFDNPGVAFQFSGEQTSGLRTLLEYRFHVPLEASHYRVKLANSWQPQAYDGSFWLDAEGLDLQRLVIGAENVPPATTICALNAELDYHRIHIGDSEALLPSKAQLHITLESSRQTHSITTFSDCREYQAESALVFEDEPQVGAATARPRGAPIAAPIGLPLVLALTEPIDTDTAAAGDVVSARVVQAVHRPHSNEVLIPANATVRGRVTRLEHHFFPSPYFLIALSFNRLEIQGEFSFFAARSDTNTDLAKELGANVFGPSGGLGYWNVGTFLFPTSKRRYVMPAGFESKWFTLATRGR
jgi:hypothetical protein